VVEVEHGEITRADLVQPAEVGVQTHPGHLARVAFGSVQASHVNGQPVPGCRAVPGFGISGGEFPDAVACREYGVHLDEEATTEVAPVVIEGHHRTLPGSRVAIDNTWCRRRQGCAAGRGNSGWPCGRGRGGKKTTDHGHQEYRRYPAQRQLLQSIAEHYDLSSLRMTWESGEDVPVRAK